MATGAKSDRGWLRRSYLFSISMCEMISSNQPLNIPSKLHSSFTDSLRNKLISLRQSLHQHLELAFHEDQTADRLPASLSSLPSARAERVTKTGIIARLRGRDPHGPVVALRGDIDVLPIQEATGLEYTSMNRGVMHACGHDVHATGAVGAAHLLVKNGRS